jgi:hypothetical protein
MVIDGAMNGEAFAPTSATYLPRGRRHRRHGQPAGSQGRRSLQAELSAYNFVPRLRGSNNLPAHGVGHAAAPAAHPPADLGHALEACEAVMQTVGKQPAPAGHTRGQSFLTASVAWISHRRSA